MEKLTFISVTRTWSDAATAMRSLVLRRRPTPPSWYGRRPAPLPFARAWLTAGMATGQLRALGRPLEWVEVPRPEPRWGLAVLAALAALTWAWLVWVR